MPIDFPNNPTSGQTYSYGINRWIYNGVAWDKLDNHPGICGGNQISINYAEGLNGATFTVNVIEGQGSGLDADLLDGVSGERFIENLETGLLYGGILSINSGNTATFDITSGLAIFTTLNATTTSAPAPTVSYTQWTAKTGVTLAGLTSTDITFVSLNSSGQFLQSNTPFTNTQYETQVPIGALVHPSRTYISFAQSYPHVAYDQASQSDIFIRSFGPLKISGHDISGYGATLQLSRASGVAYALGRNYSNDPNSPNLVSDTNANPASTIYRQYRGVTAGTWNTVVNTAVDPHYYDDGSGTLASIPGGRYSIQRVFYFPNAPTVLLVYYGRATYNSIDTAKAALVFEQFSESADTAESAIFCGYLIIKSGITNFSATSDYSIIQGGLFRSTVNVGGGGVAVANLDDLNDVTITSVANNQALVYDSSTGHWVNKSFTSLPVVSSFNGSTGAVTGVGSFNGATGTVVGVNSVRGLTGAVGITNSSGIGLSVSGQTMTFSNTGVLSVDGGTGAITNVARTNQLNIFTADQYIESSGAVFGVVDNDYPKSFTISPGSNAISFTDDSGLGYSTTLTFPATLPVIQINLPGESTTLAGLGVVAQTFSGTNTFSSLTNFSSGISAAGATFGGLARFNAGISAAGGTFSGTQTFINGATFQGNIVAPNIVTSFNGLTGTVTGVSSIRGLTGAVGITNGSGIGLSVSGQTMTFSNTGVLSFNGLTGAVTGLTSGSIGGTNGSILYKESSGISGTEYFTISSVPLSGFQNDLFSFVGPTSESIYGTNNGIKIQRWAVGLGLDEGGGSIIYADGYDPGNAGAASLWLASRDGSDDDISSAVKIGTYNGTQYYEMASFNRFPAGDDEFNCYTLANFLNSASILSKGSLFLYDLTNTNNIKIQVSGLTLPSSYTVTLPSSNTTLAGLATTQTFTGTNTFSSLTNFSGGISTAGATFSSLARFNAGISAAGATFGGNIVLQNSEFIRNTTDGRIDFMPAPAGSTHYGLYVDTTSWGFGPRFGTIRSSDDALNTANILWDAPLSIGSNTRFNLTSDSSHAFLVTTTGNDTLQLGIRINSAIYSGALALVDDSALGAANRSPGVTHANPNLYIYRAGSARATDFIRFEHDGNTGYMISGGTSDIELMPGSGIVGVSGNIQVLQNQIYVTNNARSWFL